MEDLSYCEMWLEYLAIAVFANFMMIIITSAAFLQNN